MIRLIGFVYLALTLPLFPQDSMIINARIFDGVHNKLLKGSIYIHDNLIQEIGTDIKLDKNVTVIDAKNHVVIPGLIDAHTHLMLPLDPESAIYREDLVYTSSLAVKAAEEMLMRGFTTIRDAGGPVMGVKRAIDKGFIIGPRIFPSNAFISQTGGHGDFDSSMSYLSPYFTHIPTISEINGWVKIADGVSEVQKAAREVLRSGATQLKVMASGSIMGAHDPLDATEYTYEELKAIVTEAEHWDTYVLVHAYSEGAVRNAIKAGVKSIEHGLLVKPETLKLMKEKDIWLSTQCISYSKEAKELGLEGTPMEKKFNEAKSGAEQTYKLAKEYGLKLAWGTDTFGSLSMMATQSDEFIARANYFSSYEILHQATALNASLLKLSGKRHPYQKGKLGVIAKGAYADLLIVKGNPLEDVTLLSKPQENILVIMKDGKVYKNSI